MNNRLQVFAALLAENTATNTMTQRQRLATCSTSPSYAKVDLESNTGLSLIKSDVRKYQFISSSYQKLNNDSFILVDTVAASGNNDRQERRNLLNTVQHHTIVDVFLCLSFASLPFMGELRLAIALIALWWGGSGNKPFIRRIPLAVLLRFLSLPAALHLGQIIKTTPLRKVQTK